jgi:predicted ribosomally synthesized peptide with SipW-like signal peptide
MLKFFYRLKRRGGVVLFAVIAFMTLLITMATVAYFSARASFNTVISNYDFSQMYISTTSVSDMIIDALAEDTSKAGADATKGLNYFKGLKSKIEGMITDTGGDPSKAGATLIGVSNNIAYADRDNVSKIMVDGANNAVEPGVIDAVKTTVKLESIVKDKPSSGINTYYFTITTVGYYRNNTITVQDSIYAEAGVASAKSTPLFSTFFTATGQQLKNGVPSHTTRAVIIDTQQISDNAYFQNEFTVFTGANTDCAFLGGIRTTGGLYLDKVQNYTITAPKKNGSGDVIERHDWIIGGDMYLGSNITLNLNGNDLFVHGDLYINNGHTLTAGNVYVEGNIYFLNGDGNIKIENGTDRIKIIKDENGNDKIVKSGDANGVWVNGNIIKCGGTQKTGSGTWAEGKATIADLAGKNQSDLTIADEFAAINGLINTITGNNWSGFLNTGGGGNTPQISGGPLRINGSTNNSSTVGTTFNWGDYAVQVDVQDETATEYVDKIQAMTVDNLLDPTVDGGMKRIEYDNYSADEVYSSGRVLTLNFDGIGSVAKGNRLPIGIVNGEEAYIIYNDTDNIWNSKDVVIELPYVKGGYMLKYNGAIPYMGGGGGNVTFKIKTPNGAQLDENGQPMYMTETVEKDGKQVEQIAKDAKGNPIPVPESMPIVLAANFDDGSGTATDESGFNAFRWTAAQSSNSGMVTVELVDKDDPSKSATGNVVFEMGTYDKDGKYVAYDPAKAANTEAVTYWAKEKEKVGTLNQVTNISSLQPSTPQGSDQYKFLKSGSNDIQSDYDNKIILVSNKNGAKNAFNATGGDSTFCGYLYAPNGSFNAVQDKGTMPLFGGMIVSDYNIKLGSYLYGEPDPGLIAALGTTLHKKGGNNNSNPTTAETTWYTNLGKNYFG